MTSLPKMFQLMSWLRMFSDDLSQLPTAEPTTVAGSVSYSDWPKLALREMSPHNLGLGGWGVPR